MIRKIVVSLLLLFIGCSDPVDQASSNLKKGDEFFAKKEYEIAEYYYEKIPEESPFYNLAQKKLSSIAVVKEQWKIVVNKDSAQVSQVVLVDNKYKTDNVSRVPIHILTIANHSSKELESVNVEFIYYNQAGGIIATLMGDIKTPLEPNSQKAFNNVSPGILQEKFVKCDARIMNARFH